MDNQNNHLSETIYINEQGRLTDKNIAKDIYITGMACNNVVTPMVNHMLATHGSDRSFYDLKGIVFCVDMDLIFKA